MKKLTLLAGTLYGTVSVILGALGAHAFKKVLPAEKLLSFETGVKYQMYHAILLVAIGMFLKFETSTEKWASRCIMIGAFLFPVSIYLLSFAEHWGINLKWLGPITPLGGVFMIAGWVLLFFYFLKTTKN